MDSRDIQIQGVTTKGGGHKDGWHKEMAVKMENKTFCGPGDRESPKDWKDGQKEESWNNMDQKKQPPGHKLPWASSYQLLTSKIRRKGHLDDSIGSDGNPTSHPVGKKSALRGRKSGNKKYSRQERQADKFSIGDQVAEHKLETEKEAYGKVKERRVLSGDHFEGGRL